MKRKLKLTFLVLFIMGVSNIFSTENSSSQVDPRVKLNDNNQLGHVYFHGFYFKGYDPSPNGIQSMLDATLKLVQRNCFYRADFVATETV